MLLNQHIDHVLEKNDVEFVRATYKVLLGRAADPEGERYYLDRIRKGIPKVYILAQIRKSPEYKTRNVKGAGLDTAIRNEMLQSIPLVGFLFWLLGFKARQSDMQQRLRALENAQTSLLETIPTLARHSLADNDSSSLQVNNDLDNFVKSVPIALRKITRELMESRAESKTLLGPAKQRIAETHQYPTISIVINTLNRGSLLQKTLESFRWLKYAGKFEVIVVNGPSTDNSDEIIGSWLPHIRVGKCSVANLSVSRNIGLCMAQGDIVAFIDDDAIPEPEWLTQLAEAYGDPMVGAAGGMVYNHTGYDFQYKYALVDRYGHCHHEQSGPKPHLSFPKAEQFPSLIGCNSSFRRFALMEIGGFDEEYEYFLDETDVQVRMIDAGYIIAQLPCAYVHHKFAPSNLRGENKIVRCRYPILKNHLYFMLKNSREFYSLDTILQKQLTYVQGHRDDIKSAIGKKIFSEHDLIAFEKDAERAFEVGLKRGLEGVTEGATVTAEKIKKHSGKFLPFQPIENLHYKTIVLVSRDFPPNHNGGIAVFMKDLAESLAAKGDLVHIITLSPDINRVDLENGVWVHRMVLQELAPSPEAKKRDILKHIWNWSATALEEAKRIATHRPIDIVEAPIWDCEGAAFLLDGQWPVVTNLQTTLYFWMEHYPKLKNDEKWMASWGRPMLNLEREMMTRSSAIRSNSRAIIEEIERAYGFTFDPNRTLVIPNGIPLRSQMPSLRMENKQIEILFVGRLEVRKGIDFLLQAIPQVIKSAPDVRFRLVGNDTILGPDGKTYKENFLAQHVGSDLLSKVTFEGRVSDEVLNDAYASCDIFVAPSLFESYGLIFIEAMREGKPVIGCNAGGMPEIVTHEVNGLLVEPGDAEALAQAILRLIQDPVLRNRMGNSGKKLFEEKFTSAQMAKESTSLYELAEENFRELKSYMANCGHGRWNHILSNIGLKKKHTGIPTLSQGEMNQEDSTRQEYINAVREADKGNLEPLLSLNQKFHPLLDA